MSTQVLLLINPACGHGMGFANMLGRNLLETQRTKLALKGFTGWEIVVESDMDRISAAISPPWTPCGTCGRHDLVGQPHLIGGVS